MSRSFLSKCGVFASVAALCTAAVVVAQNDPTRPGQPTTRPQGAPTQASSLTDRQLAAWLIADNENEVALAQIAQQRAKNEDVQEFAQKLVEEHQQFLTKLHKYSPSGAQERRGTVSSKDPADRDDRTPRANGSTTSPTQPGTSSGTSTVRPGQPGSQAGLDIISLKRELSEQCLQTARRELEKKQGAEFDKAFVGSQIISHMIAQDTMKVFKRHASSELQKVINEGTETAQEHLDQAKEIYKKLDNSSSKSTQREKSSDSK